MNYAVAVGIFTAVYLFGFVMPLVFGGPGSVIRMAIFSIPILLVMPRVRQRFADGEALLPTVFRRKAGFLYPVGITFIWLGHLLFFGSIIAAFYFAAQGAMGLPIGIVTGYAMYPFLVGITLVEIAFRLWASQQSAQPWKDKRKPVFIAVGLICAVQLGYNLTSGRPVDLLNYSDREALALGRGYAREVQRVVERVYAEQERIPCAGDNFLDPNSFLHSANRDLREMLSIELLECGRFVVTIHTPVDGVSDGQLLYIAAPGDADAGTPLEWQCFSAHHDRIERHTNGGCTYDQSLASSLPVPARATSTAASTATRTPAAATARSPSRPPAATSMAPQTSKPPRPADPGLQAHLDRIAEPTLWDDCRSETTSYRILKYDSTRYLAAVRIAHDSNAGAFRSVTSETPDKSIGLGGYVDDRTWARLEASFDSSGFWQLQSDRSADSSDGARIYLEACKNGTYHAVQSTESDSRLTSITRMFAGVGKLDWLEN